MSGTFTYHFDTAAYNGSVTIPTGILIDGTFVDGSERTTIDVLNPATGKLVTKVSEATAQDVDLAVKAAQNAFNTTWGLNAPGAKRAELLNKLATLMEAATDELSALKALDNGKGIRFGVSWTVMTWHHQEKLSGGPKRSTSVWRSTRSSIMPDGQTKLPGRQSKRMRENLSTPATNLSGLLVKSFLGTSPVLLMFAWKIAPALATGNTIVLKPSEFTPLTALRMCALIQEAGFPPGVVNVLTGYGNTVGAAISSHMEILKVAFTGSTIVGRKIMEAAAKSNLKPVTLELGGKSPNIIFNDADLESAVEWTAHGLYWNHGAACCAGSRIFVQSGIYDKFLKMFTEKSKSIRIGDPFGQDIDQGPMSSQAQFNRIMSYIDSAKEQGATVHLGGEPHQSEGYFIKPTIFTNTTPEMKIRQEEVFGPVGVVIRFEDENDVVRQANNTLYGLVAGVFSQNIDRAIETAHRLQAGTVWVNCFHNFAPNIPFGGYKQSGIGREMGEYGLQQYTNVKAVHINLGHKM